MEFKDYYAELGVVLDADDQTIKHAYRQLAREYHPDVCPGDTKAEERFKAINAAYQTLNDPEKRQKYDMLRQWQRQGHTNGSDAGQWQHGSNARFYTGNLSPEDLEELFGDGPFVDMFGSMFGQARSGHTIRPRRGRDNEILTDITLEEALHGTSRSLQVGASRIEAHIPPGVYTGSRVRIAGQGGPGSRGGPPGDLYLVMQIQAHPQFERVGHDLETSIAVDFYTAAVGGKVRVPTLGGTVSLKIPPRTQASKTFRLSGKGMPRLDKPHEYGDLYAQVQITLPEALSEDELAVLYDLALQHQAASAINNADAT